MAMSEPGHTPTVRFRRYLGIHFEFCFIFVSPILLLFFLVFVLWEQSLAGQRDTEKNRDNKGRQPHVPPPSPSIHSIIQRRKERSDPDSIFCHFSSVVSFGII